MRLAALVPYIVMILQWKKLLCFGVSSVNLFNKVTTWHSDDLLGYLVVSGVDLKLLQCSVRCSVGGVSFLYNTLNGSCLVYSAFMSVGGGSEPNWLYYAIVGSVDLSATTTTTTTTTTTPAPINQWVSSVKGSSSHYGTSYSPEGIIGSVDGSAWCPSSIGNLEFVELQYTQAVYLNGVSIYESWWSRPTYAIKAMTDTGHWTTVWTGTPLYTGGSTVFQPAITETPFLTSAIRLEFDCSVHMGWYGINSVKITGRPG